MFDTEPVLHEQWYLETELAMLEAATKFVKPLIGAVMEIGCWEGRSAVVIANACYPEVLLAVDTWAGSESEHPDHETVRIARVRDVFAAFRTNMQRATRGNVECHRSEAITFLRNWAAPSSSATSTPLMTMTPCAKRSSCYYHGWSLAQSCSDTIISPRTRGGATCVEEWSGRCARHCLGGFRAGTTGIT